jgi:hypothetical protein
MHMKYSEFAKQANVMFPGDPEFNPGEFEYLNSGQADGDIDLAVELVDWWEGGFHQVLNFLETTTCFASDKLFSSLMRHYLAALLFYQDDIRLSDTAQNTNNSHMYAFLTRASREGFCKTLNKRQVDFLEACLQAYTTTLNPERVGLSTLDGLLWELKNLDR